MLPGPPYGEPPASMGSAVGALIANICMLCLCGLFAVPGIILGIVGASTASSNPSSARTCTLIAWILFGVCAVIGVIYVLVYGGLWFSTYASMY
jgi:hypothetical protein